MIMTFVCFLNGEHFFEDNFSFACDMFKVKITVGKRLKLSNKNTFGENVRIINNTKNIVK